MIEIIIGLILILILGLVIIYVKNTIIICFSVFCIITIIGFGIWKLISKPSQKFQLKFIDDQANVDARPEIYCGDGDNLPDDYDRMGNRGICLRKGIGIGMGMPNASRDAFLNKPPAPPAPKLYCGNNTDVPEGYVGFDTLPNCLRRGVGVGLAMPQDKRIAFQSKPTRPLGKKEIMDLARRLGIQNVQDMTRANALRDVVGHI